MTIAIIAKTSNRLFFKGWIVRGRSSSMRLQIQSFEPLLLGFGLRLCFVKNADVAVIYALSPFYDPTVAGAFLVGTRRGDY